MLSLALANLRRRKLRSAISVLAITFIVMMIVSVFAFAGGLTDEVGQRMSSVRAELIPHLADAFGCDRYHLHTGHPWLRRGRKVLR